MEQIFKLAGHCQYVTGKNGSCLYNLLTGDIYNLSPKYVKALKNYDRKTNSFYLLDKFSYIYKELEIKDMGMILDKNTVVTPINKISSSMYENVIGSKNSIGTLYIELTNECNLDCLFCNIEEPNNRATSCKRFKAEWGEMLNYSDYKSLLLQASLLGVKNIVLIGGESLLKEEYVHCIADLCLVSNLRLNVFTNGSVPISLNTVEALNLCSAKMIIQVVASNNTDYETITERPFVWDKIVQNINVWQSNGLDCVVQLLIGNFNEAQFDNIVSKLTELTLPYTVKYIMKYPANEYSICATNKTMKPESKLTRMDPFIFKENQEHQACFANILSVSCDGKYIPCPSLRLNLGKVKELAMFEILKGKKYNKLKAMCKDLIEGCKDCKYRYGCIECRAVEYSATGKINGMKNCEVLNEL